VVAETGLSFVLLVGAGLLGRSFLRLESVRLGFEPRGVLTGGLSLPRAQYSKPAQWISFYLRLVDRLKALPGVESAAASLPLPLYGGGLNFAFQIEGRAPAGSTPGLDFTANYTAATPDYFRTLDVRSARGRLFTDADSAESPKVCLVSAAFARAFFPGEDPVGRRLVFGFTESVPREIVGVVNDVKRDGLGAPSKPEMYVPFVQDPWWASYIVMKTAGDPERLANAVRAEVRALDPDLPIDGIQPMTRTVSDSLAQPRFRTALLAIFSVTAMLLAAIGIYGVLSYAVGRRTREIGIRVALGAGKRDILRLVVAQGLGWTAAGLAAGAIGALLLTRFLSTLLFEVPPLDPATWAAVAGVLLAAGALACVVPARRAARVDPVVALRYE
jgi:putative ABC transport system permease protein